MLWYFLRCAGACLAGAAVIELSSRLFGMERSSTDKLLLLAVLMTWAAFLLRLWTNQSRPTDAKLAKKTALKREGLSRDL